MKQRTLKNRTLAERSIYRGWEEKNPCEHVRAELQRLARQVRKLNTYGDKPLSEKWIRQVDVLALLKEAQR